MRRWWRTKPPKAAPPTSDRPGPSRPAPGRPGAVDVAPQEAVRVYRTDDRAAALLVSTVLTHLGFDARLAGDEAGSVIATRAAMSLDVRVPGEEAAEAVALLGRLTRTDERGRLSLVSEGEEAQTLVEAGLHPEAQGQGAPEPEVCPQCGAPWEPGFEVCWSCLWELPGAPASSDAPDAG